jgi:uncharacterized protein YecA (UPF0149 family)
MVFRVKGKNVKGGLTTHEGNVMNTAQPIETPAKFEEEYPGAAAILGTLCKDRQEYMDRTGQRPSGLRLDLLPGSDKPCGRNDSCPCGSGKKYKKCCL